MTLQITPIDYDTANSFVESAAIELTGAQFEADIEPVLFDLELSGANFEMTVAGPLEIDGEDSGLILT